MRAQYPVVDTALIAAHIEATPSIARVRATDEECAAANAETILAILDEASKFAELHLAPLNDGIDAHGCTLIDGRVTTADGHRQAWAAFVAAGWPTLEQPVAAGGQGLPLIVAVAAQEVFDRACPAFGMMSVPQRAAAKLIAAHGSPALQTQWLPSLATGAWGAAITISEVEAGSDVGRIRTQAILQDDGRWQVTGEKCWISLGDHDLTPRIGYCLLARTPGAAPGAGGLSLFMVSSVVDTEAGPVRNAVSVRRIEHKMGLHGSPTCALGFEGAVAELIGTEGRGLAQMFVMITNMRLSVGVQGLAIAGGCADTALHYAEERRQGGTSAQAVRIAEHADVQRQLLGMIAAVETMRGLVLEAANLAEIAARATDETERMDAAALVQWLLPIVKTTGGEIAFDTASAAMQVLGGAGYTREWPVEQALRDARVLTIFEGTTGIQALDLLHRRLLRGDRRGFDVFRRGADASLAACPAGEAKRYGACLGYLDAAAVHLSGMAADTHGRDAGATAFLHLAALAATGWIAARLCALDDDGSPSHRRLIAAGRHHLHDIDARAAMLATQIERAAGSLAPFAQIRVAAARA
ncbi:acyl-CoA dehydrogenase family protein [Sphingomonas sp.]|jgi:hypothetical protein|uniref:acyl-CoA dehydrogenase family protein n=1 Tax=Sphingomonas sp. TaxID=28214 RepID=UPI002ED981A8